MSTALFISFYFNCLFALVITFFSLKKLKGGFLKDVLFNFCFLSFLMFNLFAVLEFYFRFIYDQTDNFLFTKISRKWLERHVTFNKAGFRDKERSLESNGSFRIAVLGDSFVLGVGIENPQERFPDLLEKKLNLGGGRVEVLNWSRLNWETTEELNFFQEKGRKYEIDFLVLSYYLNDIAANSKLEQPPAYFLVTNPYLAFFVGHSYAMEFFYYRATNFINRSMVEFNEWGVNSYLHQSSWENHREELISLIKSIRERNVSLAVVIFPFMTQVNNYPTKYQQVHQKLADFFEEQGVSYIDLLEEFKEYSVDQLVVSRYDAHPSSFANQLVAERLYRFFKEKDVVKEKLPE